MTGGVKPIDHVRLEAVRYYVTKYVTRLKMFAMERWVGDLAGSEPALIGMIISAR